MDQRPPLPLALRLATIALLVAFPATWVTPLMRAGLLPLFGLLEISVLSGVQSLWRTDVPLAVLVTFLALVAPLVKLLGLLLVQYRLASPRMLPALEGLGKLAMADVFLIALYVVLVKGIGLATVETAWGLYVFTGAVLAGIGLGHWTARAVSGRQSGPVTGEG